MLGSSIQSQDNLYFEQILSHRLNGAGTLGNGVHHFPHWEIMHGDMGKHFVIS